MTILAALYTDEDMSALVATLLRTRGLDITTVPEAVAVFMVRIKSEHQNLAFGLRKVLMEMVMVEKRFIH